MALGGAPHRDAEEILDPLTPSTDECTDLANGSRETVELAADGGRAGLGCEQTEAVARAELAEAEEDAVNNLHKR